MDITTQDLVKIRDALDWIIWAASITTAFSFGMFAGLQLAQATGG